MLKYLLWLCLAGLTPGALLAQAPAGSSEPGVAAYPKWAAEFSGIWNVRGIAALRFTSPRTAWRLNAELAHNVYDTPGDDYRFTNLGIGVGRRWYGPRIDRVQSFLGLGVTGHYFEGRRSLTGYLQVNKGYMAGAEGTLGAQIFVAPEISLGATWYANLGFEHNHTSQVDTVTTYSYMTERWRLTAGDIRVTGTIFF